MDERADLSGRVYRPDDLTTGTPVEPAPVAEPLDQENPEEIRDDIEQTRSAMSETIDAIQERLSPDTLVSQAKDSVREATIGRAEQVVNDASDTVRETGSSFMETIRQNPVPAAMAAFGIGWLLTHRQSGASGRGWQGNQRGTPGAMYREYEPGYGNYGRSYGRGYYAGYGQQYESAPRFGSWQQSGGLGSTSASVQDRVGDMASQAQDQAGQFVNQAQDQAAQMAGQVQDQVGQWSDQAQQQMSQWGDQAQQGMGQLRWQLDRWINENPLAMGAIALGVGAAIGMAIPETPQENQLMGQARDTVVDRAQSMAQDTVQKVETVAENSDEVAQHAAQAAVQAAKESVKDQLSSQSGSHS